MLSDKACEEPFNDELATEAADDTVRVTWWLFLLVELCS